MSTATWHYLENQFDAATKGSRKRMDAIVGDTYPKVENGAKTNPALQPVLDALTPAQTGWDTDYGLWKQAIAGWRSTTQQIENLFSILQVAPGAGQRSLLDKWESKVASYWAVDDPIYAGLFPKGREPFSEGTRKDIIGEVERLGQRLAAQASELTAAAAVVGLPADQAADLTEQAGALAKLAAEVTAFYGQLETARTAQDEKEGAVDQTAVTCEAARVIMATALYKALALLMAIFSDPAQRGQVTGFFDLSLIMNPPTPQEADAAEQGTTPTTPTGK